jgi:hypothetical protein
VETRWDTWQALHPETLVVSSDTGFDRGGYSRYPYVDPNSGDYRNNQDLLFTGGQLGYAAGTQDAGGRGAGRR